ncbi:protein kinase [Nonomuraea mangrovi]|uniref:non-specific serine/threonine protein kinase n=1 Tax=Nonomuraea mangrovi TaxID=2316207 RepID=A0ABW4SYM8_9ACTN
MSDRLLGQVPAEGPGVPGGTESHGRLVGRRYKLLSPVGRGGMGMVWHAHDVLLDRPVAVKELILPYGLDHAGKQVAHRRMMREARSAARLGHPGIVTVHDVVEEDGRPWIVMELVRAWSLEQAVRQSGPLPVIQAAEIGIRVLDALRHAHAAGILHRDVKPGNVLLTADRVVLTDFGIAAIEGDVTITQTGLLMGSPAYVPPERLSGQPITQAADLWSFGATLYAAVEGRPPYEGPDAIAVLGAVLTQDPVRPQRAGAMLPVIEGLLRKNPAERMNAGQVADLLERVLASHGGGSPRSQGPIPTPSNSTPAHLLPPLDPPSGPLPTRIVETPSGPVRVPYDPQAGPSEGTGTPSGAHAHPQGFDAFGSSSGGSTGPVPDAKGGFDAMSDPGGYDSLGGPRGYDSTGGHNSVGGHDPAGGYHSAGGYDSTGGYDSVGGRDSAGGYHSVGGYDSLGGPSGPHGYDALHSSSDPRGYDALRSSSDPRGSFDPRSSSDPRGSSDSRGSFDPRGYDALRSSSDPRGFPSDPAGPAPGRSGAFPGGPGASPPPAGPGSGRTGANSFPASPPPAPGGRGVPEPQPILPLTDSLRGGSPAAAPWPLTPGDEPRSATRDDLAGHGRRRNTGGGWTRDGRPTPRLIVTLVAVIGAAAAAIVVLTSGGSPSEPSVSATTAASPAPVKQPLAAVAVPEGFKEHTPEGFTAAVPAEWKLSASGGEAIFTGPKDSGMKITVEQASPQKDGGLAELTGREADGGVEGYIQVQLQEVRYRSWKAADWEYQYTQSNGVPMQVLTRYVTLDDRDAFQITFTTPQLRWDDQAETRKVFLDTFRPTT